MGGVGIRGHFPIFAIISLLVLWGGCLATFKLPWVENAGICTALRNWDEYGYSQLKGEFVLNPGGLAPGEEWQLYPGHRKWSIMPQYVIGHLLGGPNRSLLPFYLILSTAIAVSIWFFFKKTDSAALLAALVILCPGYSRYALGYDPIGIPILWGIPAMALIIHLMQAEGSGTWKRMTFASLILLLYTAMNWSVVFSVAAGMACLLLIKPARIKLLLPIVIGAGLLVLLVTYISLANKYGAATHKAAGSINAFDAIWDGYLWGKHGYGEDPSNSMTLFKALPRIIVVSIIGQLPLIIYYLNLLVKEFRRVGWRRLMPCLAPLGAVILGILTLRNLFGHHSWMAGPPLISGMIFSMALLERRRESVPVESPALAGNPFAIRAALLMGAFVYMFVILLASRAYLGGVPELVDLVTDNTSRHSLILLAPDLPAQVIDQSGRMAGIFDRKVAFYSDWKGGSARPEGGVYVLCSTPRQEKELQQVASTHAGGQLGRNFFRSFFSFYQRHVARRNAGDKLEVDSPYYLYRLAQP